MPLSTPRPLAETKYDIRTLVGLQLHIGLLSIVRNLLKEGPENWHQNLVQNSMTKWLLLVVLILGRQKILIHFLVIATSIIVFKDY